MPYKPSSPFLYKFFSPLLFLIMLGIYLECACLLGTALIPGVGLVLFLYKITQSFPLLLKIISFSFSIGFGFFLFGLTLVFLVPLFSRILGLGAPVGKFSFYTLEGIRWFLYSANIHLVRISFLEFILITPLLNLFFRMMGARIGKKVFISTPTIFDCNLISIGDHTVIGGYSIVICHSAEGNTFEIEPIKIGERVTIGVHSVILPGVVIGDGATIAANSVVPKGMQIPPNTTWGGVPVKQIVTGNMENKHFLT